MISYNFQFCSFHLISNELMYQLKNCVIENSMKSENYKLKIEG